MKSLSGKARTALTAIIIAVICLAVLIVTNRNTAYQSKGFYDTPEDAFKAEFQTNPDISIPCGDHMHMYGRDKSDSFDKGDLQVSTVAAKSEAGWYVSEKANLMTERFNQSGWNDPDGWSNLCIDRPTNCHKSLIWLEGNLSDTSSANVVLNKISDTAETEFIIRSENYPGIGDLYFVFGIADVQENGYKLYFDSECIYP